MISIKYRSPKIVMEEENVQSELSSKHNYIRLPNFAQNISSKSHDFFLKILIVLHKMKIKVKNFMLFWCSILQFIVKKIKKNIFTK